MFPDEGPIRATPLQSEFEEYLTYTFGIELPRPSEPLFEVNSEASLLLNEEQGSNSTPPETELSDTEATHSSHPTPHTYYSYASRDFETPPSEDDYLNSSSVSIAHSVGRSSLPYLFTEYEPVEPRPGLVRRPFHQHFNQPLSYEDPFVLLQLPEPTFEPWQNTPEYQQILRDGRGHIMDPFPSLMESDLDLHHKQSVGEGPMVPLLHSDHWVPFSQRESPEPSLFHYQPLPA